MKKNSFKMELIETREQLLENIATLKKYLIGNNQNNKAFAFGIIQNGRNFFVIQEEDKSFSFFPSRFIGYKRNTREKHEWAKSSSLLDGKETSPAISKILAKKHIEHEEFEKEYKMFYRKIGVGKISLRKRRYWILNELEDLLRININYTERIIQSIEKKLHVSTSEKQQIAKARIGQSVIREKLLETRKHCEVCQIKQKELLVASHIKPWSESDDYEKGDLNNLLLLCAMHDALFDKGFISFDEEGKIIVSAMVNEEELEKYLLNKKMKITVDNAKSKFLMYHRKNIFKK